MRLGIETIELFSVTEIIFIKKWNYAKIVVTNLMRRATTHDRQLGWHAKSTQLHEGFESDITALSLPIDANK
jgi:hypothetical protein